MSINYGKSGHNYLHSMSVCAHGKPNALVQHHCNVKPEVCIVTSYIIEFIPMSDRNMNKF